MKIRDLVTEVMDNVQGAGLPTPSRDRVIRQLNRSRDVCLGRLQTEAAPDLLVYVKDVSVTAAAASFALPTGTEAGKPAVSRIVSLDRVVDGVETRLKILTTRERDAYCETFLPIPGYAWPPNPSAPYVYLQGESAFFVAPAGAPEAMTIRVRYTGIPQPWSETDVDDELDRALEPIEGAIVQHATAALLPGKSDEHRRYKEDAADSLEIAIQNFQQRNFSEPPHIRMVD